MFWGFAKYIDSEFPFEEKTLVVGSSLVALAFAIYLFVCFQQGPVAISPDSSSPQLELL